MSTTPTPLTLLLRYDREADSYFSSLPQSLQYMVENCASNVTTLAALREYAENLTHALNSNLNRQPQQPQQ